MLEMAINNVEMGSELDRVHILTCCEIASKINHLKSPAHKRRADDINPENLSSIDAVVSEEGIREHTKTDIQTASLTH